MGAAGRPPSALSYTIRFVPRCSTRLSGESRRKLHEQVALSLQRNSPDRVFDLAYHFDAAGQSERALEHALLAARQARSQHSLEVAEQQYRIAERGAHAGRTDHAVRYRRRAGRRVDAAGTLRCGRRTVREGRPPGGRPGARRPRSRASSANWPSSAGTWKAPPWPSRRRSACWAEPCRDAPSSFVPNAGLGSGDSGARTRCFPPILSAGGRISLPKPSCWPCGCSAGWHTDTGTCAAGSQTLWAHLRGMNLVERYRSDAGTGPSLFGARAGNEPDRLLQPRHRVCGEVVRAAALVWRLVGAGPVAEFSQHSAVCRLALRRVRRKVARGGAFVAAHGRLLGTEHGPLSRGAALYRLGDLRGALEAARHIHQSGLELGDEQASGISLDIWAFATGGRVPEETLKARTEAGPARRPGNRPGDARRRSAADGPTAISRGGRPFHAGAGGRQTGGNRQRLRRAEPRLAGHRTCDPRPSSDRATRRGSGSRCSPRRSRSPPGAADRALASERPSARPSRIRPNSRASRTDVAVRAACSKEAWRSPSGKEPSTSTRRRCWPTASCGGSWVGPERTSRSPPPKPPCGRSLFRPRRRRRRPRRGAGRRFRWSTGSTRCWRSAARSRPRFRRR